MVWIWTKICPLSDPSVYDLTSLSPDVAVGFLLFHIWQSYLLLVVGLIIAACGNRDLKTLLSVFWTKQGSCTSELTVVVPACRPVQAQADQILSRQSGRGESHPCLSSH